MTRSTTCGEAGLGGAREATSARVVPAAVVEPLVVNERHGRHFGACARLRASSARAPPSTTSRRRRAERRELPIEGSQVVPSHRHALAIGPEILE